MKLLSFFLAVLMVFALVKPASAYSRIKEVEMWAPFWGNVDQEIPVQAGIKTGNNAVEYVHNVTATLLLPPTVKLVSGVNPLFIGEMGPGPAQALCEWTVEFEEAGEYVLVVNASCIDTQRVPLWMSASATIQVGAPPHVEFEYTPATNIRVNETVIFNASRSYARGPNSTIVSYAWDFGDGTNATSTEPRAEHKFLGMGKYTILLNATDMRELFSMNSTEISVGLAGDLNGDGTVDIVDVVIVAAAFGSTPEQPNWNPIADLNDDGTINIVDVSLVAMEYGKTA